MGVKERLKDWKNAFIAISVMVVAAPVFAWAANLVEYVEPLEVAAEKVGALEHGYTWLEEIIPGYVIPGINPYLSTIPAGILGCLIVLAIGLAIGRFLQRKEN